MAREGYIGRYLPWRLVIVYLTCLFAFCTDLVDCMILPPINWNASNPMFKTSNNDHVIQVNMYDELDFICPQFSEWEDSPGAMEYYIIYQVSKSEYEDCNIYPESKAIKIVNCSSPSQRKRFTLLFEPFASIPHVPEFKGGNSYYYISTSTGHQDGISNKQQGACFYRNMKLTIKVCCDTTTTSTTPQNISSPTIPPTPTPTPTHVPLLDTTEAVGIEREGLETEATTTTTTSTTTTPRRRTSTTSSLKTKSTTEGNSIKYTDKVLDKTSTKPGKEKVPGNENHINKPPEDVPKTEGLVNGARTLLPPGGLSSSLALALSSLQVLLRLLR